MTTARGIITISLLEAFPSGFVYFKGAGLQLLKGGSGFMDRALTKFDAMVAH